MAKLFRLTRTTKPNDYDYVRGAIVVALDAQSAKEINPTSSWPGEDYEFTSWERTPQTVTATYIGEASPDLAIGSVVLIDARNG